MPDKNGRSYGVKMLNDIKGRAGSLERRGAECDDGEIAMAMSLEFPVASMPAYELACAKPTGRTDKPHVFVSRHIRAQLQRSTGIDEENRKLPQAQAIEPVGIIQSMYDTAVQTWRCTKRHHIERSEWSSSHDHQPILHPTDTPVVSIMNLAAISPYISPYVTCGGNTSGTLSSHTTSPLTQYSLIRLFETFPLAA